MDKKIIAVGFGALIVLISIWVFPSEDTFAFIQSEEFATEWVMEKSSYAHGGTDLVVVNKENLGSVYCHLCYQFEFSFQLPQEGLASKVPDLKSSSSYNMILKMEDGKITSAVTNNSFDELKEVSI